MDSNLSFNMDGPMITGTWYNPNTGDSFTVKDSFFMDNNYIVTTTDGRRLDYNVIQNYIQSDKPIAKMPPKSTASLGNLNTNLDDLMLEDDRNLFNVPSTPDHESFTHPISTPPVVNVNNEIIDKALCDCEMPNIKVSVEYDKLPKEEITMLVKFMKMSYDDIADYILNKIQKQNYNNIIKEEIISYLNNTLNKHEELMTNPYTEPVIKEEVVKEAPVKKVEKTTTKKVKPIKKK